MPTKYVRLAFKSYHRGAKTSSTRIVWAEDHTRADSRYRRFEVVNKDGGRHTPRELLVVDPKDIVDEKPAHMNPTYGWLEVTKP